MQQNKFLNILVFLLFFLSSCITEYIADIKPDNLNKIVIYGLINNQEGYQSIEISYASSVKEPEFIPYSKCKATLITSNGIKISLTESETSPGIYGAFISKDNLALGSSLKLIVETPDGNTIESTEEIIPTESKIDTIYYKKITYSFAENGNANTIIQFFTDFSSNSEDTKYYWWEEHETYEYHANYNIEWIYYRMQYTHISPPDSSLKYCWRTLIIPDLILFSTENLNQSVFKEFPLHIVDQISKFQYGYSLEVRQNNLSPSAYHFLSQVKTNSANGGGLYMKQPMEIIGNLRNITHPDQTIMGNFGVCSASIERIFVEPFPEFPIYEYTCSIISMSERDFQTQSNKYPLYIMDNGRHTAPTGEILSNQCVVCTSFGGTTDKPSFWPK